MNIDALGRHILVELYHCNVEKLSNVKFIEDCLLHAANLANATVINCSFHHFVPLGVSGVVVIEESHISIHTWPEYAYASLDIFTCGEKVNTWLAFDYIKQQLESQNCSTMELMRGQRQFFV